MWYQQHLRHLATLSALSAAFFALESSPGSLGMTVQAKQTGRENSDTK
jgi:hypothetical protein